MKPWEEIETERERGTVSTKCPVLLVPQVILLLQQQEEDSLFFLYFLNGRDVRRSTHTHTHGLFRVLVRGSEALALGGAEVGRLHGVEFVDGIDGWGGEEVARSALRPAPQSLLQPHQAALLAVQAEVALQIDAASAPFRMRRRTVVRTCNEEGERKGLI